MRTKTATIFTAITINVIKASEEWRSQTGFVKKGRMKFGESVPGYNIPVLNEREVRASAGILLVFISISIMRVAFVGDFQMLKFFVITFIGDFIIRVFVSPKFSPTLILGRLIVSNQVPEYVGAAQKRFAWIIGLSLATLIFTLLVVFNAHSFITGGACIICLIFLFLETAFGICVGCAVYRWFHKEKAQYCPGEICDVTNKQDIQKTSRLQLLIIFAFAAYVGAAVFFFHDTFSAKPRNLWEVIGSMVSG